MQIHLNTLPPECPDKARVGIDSEFFGMEESRMHLPHGTFAILGCTYDGENVYFISDPSMIPEFYKRIDKGIHIYHNAAFDLCQLAPYHDELLVERTRIWDTMLVDQVRYRGYYSSFSLQSLTRRYLNKYRDKSVRDTFSTTDTLTQEQIEYAADDIVDTWKIGCIQLEEIDDNDYRIVTGIEHPFLYTLLTMESIPINPDMWQAVEDKHKQEAEELEATMSWNSRSSKQVLEALEEEQEGAYGLSSTGARFLEKIQGDSEVAKLTLEHRHHANLVSKYGMNFIKDYLQVHPQRGYFCVRPHYWQIGAETGRTSASDPAIQTVPAREGPEFRECFTVIPYDNDFVMMVFDWGSQEPRSMAYLSQDRKLIEIFQSGKDVYIEIARLIYNEEITKKDPRRNTMKVLVLAVMYKMSAWGLANKLECTEDEAQDLLDLFFDTFPGVKKWSDNQTKRNKYKSGTGYVETILGRKFYINSYVNGWERNTVNAPNQGTGADAMKIAANEIRRRWKGNPICGFVHDEILLVIDKMFADTLYKMVHDIMVEVGESLHKGIPSVVEGYMGNSWAVKG